MKNLLILATMLLTVGFANAQSKIYRGNSTSDRNLIGTYDGGMIYKGNSTSNRNLVGTISDGKIYRGNSTSDRNLIGTYDGGMMSGAAGAAFLLLL
jgi:hypothetical protein